MHISEKKVWVSTGGWGGYYKPITAVGGANNTGNWSDSPCPSHVCEAEIKEFRALLRKNKIRSKVVSCTTSNIFCMAVYVCVLPKDKESALRLAEAHMVKTRLFYSC